MFGEKIDYFLLKPLAHKRNYATEEELNKKVFDSSFDLSDAKAYLKKVTNVYFDGKVPIDTDLIYVDIGCGMGRLCFGLLEAGVKDITGIDIIPRNIDEAKVIAEKTGFADCVKLEHSDIHQWKTNRTYDVIFVLGAMEHIHDPDKFLQRLATLMKPNGLAFISHEPFQSPIGDHLHGFFRLQIPWRGLIFSEKALLRLRKEFFRPTDPAEKYSDVAGGLNQVSYSKLVRYIAQAGLKIEHTNFTPQLKRYPPIHLLFKILTKIPWVRNYFIMSAYLVLRRDQ